MYYIYLINYSLVSYVVIPSVTKARYLLSNLNIQIQYAHGTLAPEVLLFLSP